MQQHNCTRALSSTAKRGVHSLTLTSFMLYNIWHLVQKQTCIPSLKGYILCDSISKTSLTLDSIASYFRGRHWKSITCLEFPVSKEISVTVKQKKKRDLSIWNAQPAQSSCFSNSLCDQRCVMLTWSHSAPYRWRKRWALWAVELLISDSACCLVFYLTCSKTFDKSATYTHAQASFYFLYLYG